MALPIIAGVARCAVSGVTANVQPWVNVLHLRTIGATAWTTADSTAAYEALHDLYWLTGFGVGTEGWAYYAAAPAEVRQFDITPLDGTSPTVTTADTLPATPSQDQLPGEVALIISHLTAVRGRSGRGRTYWASPYEGISNSIGEVDASNRTAIEATWFAFRSALAASDLELVVASYIGAGSARVVNDDVVRPYFGHQDRRRR